ncbi:MAG: outer membrane protein assembly factor BamE [Gammaproteobacteria bacterium]|nr:outer membrane protein assembly factor BamE [Gammaproteobacteria bacterium]
MKFAWRTTICVCLFSLVGCSDGLLHRVDKQQGNLLTQDMVAQLKPGMDHEQVLFILGQPVLRNSFDTNRWDYVYTFAPRSRRPEKRLLTLYFKDGKLNRLESNNREFLPANPEGEAEVAERR